MCVRVCVRARVPSDGAEGSAACRSNCRLSPNEQRRDCRGSFSACEASLSPERGEIIRASFFFSVLPVMCIYVRQRDGLLAPSQPRRAEMMCRSDCTRVTRVLTRRMFVRRKHCAHRRGRTRCSHFIFLFFNPHCKKQAVNPQEGGGSTGSYVSNKRVIKSLYHANNNMNSFLLFHLETQSLNDDAIKFY